jgi:hypothetical protein
MPSNRTFLHHELIPEPLWNSPLMRKGGFDAFEGILSDNAHKLMLSEAVQLSVTAQVSDVPVSDDEEVRGGSPARRFLSAPGGEIQEAFCHADWLLGFLREVTGVPQLIGGGRGTYTYYARPGDYLALHRDVDTCDLAVITCLHDGPNLAGQGGVLCLYPTRLFEALSSIRESPGQGEVGLRLRPGQTLVMFGGIVPHALSPVVNGQMRIISVLCYRIDPPSSARSVKINTQTYGMSVP